MNIIRDKGNKKIQGIRLLKNEEIEKIMVNVISKSSILNKGNVKEGFLMIKWWLMKEQAMEFFRTRIVRLMQMNLHDRYHSSLTNLRRKAAQFQDYCSSINQLQHVFT